MFYYSSNAARTIFIELLRYFFFLAFNSEWSHQSYCRHQIDLYARYSVGQNICFWIIRYISEMSLDSDKRIADKLGMLIPVLTAMNDNIIQQSVNTTDYSDFSRYLEYITIICKHCDTKLDNDQSYANLHSLVSIFCSLVSTVIMNKDSPCISHIHQDYYSSINSIYNDMTKLFQSLSIYQLVKYKSIIYPNRSQIMNFVNAMIEQNCEQTAIPPAKFFSIKSVLNDDVCQIPIMKPVTLMSNEVSDLDFVECNNNSTNPFKTDFEVNSFIESQASYEDFLSAILEVDDKDSIAMSSVHSMSIVDTTDLEKVSVWDANDFALYGIGSNFI